MRGAIFRAVTILFIIVLAYATPPAQATLLPAVSSVTVGFATATHNQSQTDGWQFRPNVDIEVAALGIIDLGAGSPVGPHGDGLVDPHQLGLWTSTGTLLRTTTIPEGTGSPLVGLFRYTEIPSCCKPTRTT
jgi:hypothetical protein